MGARSRSEAVGSVTEPEDPNGEEIAFGRPYRVGVTLQGSSDLLFHRWSVESVKEKAAAVKGSKAKKTDNVESYVWRDDKSQLCLPGEYVRQATIHAAKFRQDPRSPRKSAKDLYSAGLISLSRLSPLTGEKKNLKEWDYLDERRVVIQRAGINRVRPAIKEGWTADFVFLVNTPQYISATALHEVMSDAGRLIGLADFRPSYGRFNVVNFEVLKD